MSLLDYFFCLTCSLPEKKRTECITGIPISSSVPDPEGGSPEMCVFVCVCVYVYVVNVLSSASGYISLTQLSTSIINK